ncbi:MAG: phosphoribosylamine--glycine ligase [Bacteroidia bacterium]|nr:phosphoribosylamine--glycine ligase [Bacteroidia bacterium]
MNILLIGSGGREHALAWKISSSPHCTQLYIAPGNAGTGECGINIPVSVIDFPGLKKTILDNSIDLVIVGPEEPLVKGFREYLADDSSTKNVLIVGPGKIGAQLEGSKDFAKAFMLRNEIPTAAYKTFEKENLDEAFSFLESLKPPYVLKADGLAAGKGVIISPDIKHAKAALEKLLTGRQFGAASDKVVIEEFLHGIELSVFVLTDGKKYIILPEAKDYKRIGDGDTGPNTGGMGAVSPVPFADASFLKKVEERIIKPTINGFINEGIDYRGFVFIGLMNVAGEPFVIEYNVRLGDPETEVVIPRIKSDFVELLSGAAAGNFSSTDMIIDSNVALTVMLVSGGYPGDYEQGKIIHGINAVKECKVFQAGTKAEGSNILSQGGRVLAITAQGSSIKEVRGKVYLEIDKISFDKMNFRKDIGLDLMEIEFVAP